MREAFVIFTTVCAIVLGLTALAFILSFWQIWWLYPAWAWFLVPLGLPQVSFWFVWGLLIAISYKPTTHVIKHKCDIDTSWSDATTVIIGNIIGPVITYWILLFLHNLG